MVFNNNLLLGASGAGGAYTIDQSIRFNDDDDAHLYSTSFSASPTSSTDCTFSTWVKRGNFGSYQVMLYGGNPAGSTAESIRFDNDEDLRISQASSAYDLKTDQKFSDVAGWYHIVVALDTDNATASERIKLYVNGERVTSFSTETYPSSGYSTNYTSGAASVAHVLGANAYEGLGPDSQHFDGYQAEINFIDGQVLGPENFGEVNSDTGQWVPIEYTGSYGTNGFYLTGATATDLGEDFSGNNNDFTSSSGGFTAADQMLDTPTNNFWTLNPTDPHSSSIAISEGNLRAKMGAATTGSVFASMLPETGKWAWEITATLNMGSGTEYPVLGIVPANNADLSGPMRAGGTGEGYGADGRFFSASNGTNSAYGATWADGDIIEVGWDADNGALSFWHNGSAQGTAVTGLTGRWKPAQDHYTTAGGDTLTDFGQSGYTPTDSSYKTLCTANLPDPTIALPEKYFNTVLYEGNGGGQRVGGFQPITETYTVPNSVIFNDDDSAYLTRTPSSSGDKRTWTFSAWVKRGNIGADRRIFTAASNGTEFFFDANDKLNFYHYSGGFVWQYISNAVFKDSSAWNHFVLRVDTTDATAGDRIKVYVNGVQITDWGTSTAPSLNAEGFVNGTSAHYIGRYSGSDNNHWDGYLAEINHIDGSSLGPDSFGQLDASTNRWIPKDASGLTFGTNGFYLDMETAPGTGSGAGTDSSGNGNNFTESGFAAADQVDDSPTKNFCVLNPNDSYGSGLTLSDGNLRAVPSAGAYCNNHGTIYVGSGKWVYEVKHTTVFGEAVGWSPLGETIDGSSQRGWFMFTDGRAYINTTNQGTLGTSLSSGDYRYIFYDADKKAMWFAHCDVSSGTPTTLVYENGATKAEIESGDTSNAVFTGIDPVDLAPGIWMDTSGVIETNFGQSSFYTTSTLPTGFNTLNNDNLPLSNGDLSAFVWIKNRDAADNHMLFDAVRGVTKDVHSNSTAAEVTNANTLTRFLKNGFEVSNDAEVNTAGESYVAWQWLTDSLTTSSNEDGSTTSTVLADTTSGFSIVSYTGTGTAATVGHGLGVAPSMIIAKNRSTTSNWSGYHVDIGATKTINLNETAAAQTSSGNWNNTEPTSSVFSVNTATGTNGSGNSIVAYCFAEVEGFSKFGSYTGNGSTDGPFIYTGFKPRFVMIKRYTSTESWPILDTARGSGNFGSDAGSGGDNPTAGNDLNAVLVASTTAAEEDNPAGSRRASYVSNGFKVRTTNTAMNASGSGYIYMAFAESPFKTATAR